MDQTNNVQIGHQQQEGRTENRKILWKIFTSSCVWRMRIWLTNFMTRVEILKKFSFSKRETGTMGIFKGILDYRVEHETIHMCWFMYLHLLLLSYIYDCHVIYFLWYLQIGRASLCSKWGTSTFQAQVQAGPTQLYYNWNLLNCREYLYRCKCINKNSYLVVFLASLAFCDNMMIIVWMFMFNCNSFILDIF